MAHLTPHWTSAHQILHHHFGHHSFRLYLQSTVCLIALCTWYTNILNPLYCLRISCILIYLEIGLSNKYLMQYCLMRLLLELFTTSVDSVLCLLHGQASNDLTSPRHTSANFPSCLVPFLSHGRFFFHLLGSLFLWYRL